MSSMPCRLIANVIDYIMLLSTSSNSCHVNSAFHPTVASPSTVLLMSLTASVPHVAVKGTAMMPRDILFMRTEEESLTSENVASLLASLTCQQSTLQQSEQGKRTLSSIRINVIELFYLRGLCRTKYANVGEGL